MKKSIAWIGVIFGLLLFGIGLAVGISIVESVLIIVSSIGLFIYIIGLVILIIDYYQTR